MTDDEFFTAIYLVCGSLPSKPESQPNPRSMSTMFRRKLPNGQEQMWMVDDAKEYMASYDMRVIWDPGYMEYFDRAAKLGITMQQFGKYIAWAEAYEQSREKI